MKKYAILIQMIIVLILLQGCGLFNNQVQNGPIITGSETITLEVNQEYPDWKSLISAYDEEDGNIVITDSMIDATAVDHALEGSYQVIYKVKDSDNNSTTFILEVHVISPTYQYAQGTYDLSTLDGSSKAMIYNVMETYLLENVIGGVPLYRTNQFYMFSERVELFSETYNPIFGFGHDFSNLLSDDSHVLLDDETYGEENQYTFRSTYKYTIESDMWNPYKTDIPQEMIDYMHGSLYTYEIDDSFSGFNYKEELAKELPIAVNAEQMNGQTYAHIWQIPVKDDLMWSFHPNIDTEYLPEQYQVLDASDFLWTWQTAIKESWFRAVSSGNDFISQGILNAEAYKNGLITDIDQVGLRLATNRDNTLEIEFEDAKSYDDIIFMFAQKDKSPLNEELYDFVDKQMAIPFGTAPETIASSGPYMLESVDLDQTVHFVRNENYVYKALYHYTGIQFRLMNEIEAFQTFLDGKLDMAIVPREEALNHVQDERMIGVPNSTTFRLLINGFSSDEQRDAYFNFQELPENYRNWELEPILQYKEMKQALYSSIDRLQFSDLFAPAYTYYANHYIVDIDGTSIYGNPLGIELLNTYNQDAFDIEKARQLFHQAIEKAMTDGYYTNEIENATKETPYFIPIELTYSEAQNSQYIDLIMSIAAQLEDNLYDHQLNVGVEIILNAVEFPSVYYDYITIGQTDLAIGGLSGMSIPQDLNQFRDDQKMYPLNFGIDTSTANIEIKYINVDGDYVYEIWSFNAMCEALKGEVVIIDGVMSENE